jgi:hypothetical protein
MLQNLRIRRVWDANNRVVIYTAYSTRFTGGRSVCVSLVLARIARCMPAYYAAWSTILMYGCSTTDLLRLLPCPVAAAEEKELSTSRYRTSVCAVPVGRAPPLVPVATEAVAP